MIVSDVMTPAPVYLSARDTVAAAAGVFRAHRLPVLPVLDAGSLAGVVTPVDLLAQDARCPLADVMTRGVVPATPDLPLLQAHVLFVSQQRDVLPVLDGARPAGYVSLTAVLRAVSQATDPLTGLPWATGLRMWAADTLTRGHEISVVFVDLDNFREVNRAFGYVAGDGVLRMIADMLQRSIDPRTDVLCRYGSDKFAIATSRTGEAVGTLASRLGDAVTIPVAGADPLTASVGYAGGRRRRVRAPGHAAATVSDLLALACRASRLAKHAPARETGRSVASGHDALPGGARAKLLDVQLDSGAAESVARVRLRLGAHEVEGVSSAVDVPPVDAARTLVADATLRAVHGILGEPDVYSVENVFNSLPTTYPLAIAVLSARPAAGRGPERYVGGATALDLPRAVCKAVLDAINRPLAPRLGALLAAERLA
ncbi:MAG TPA: GGDEF domain-containing protein [bacterium]|nr:GGDEF domain-containing protein [bacterium]